jgi:hypothetical protein
VTLKSLLDELDSLVARIEELQDKIDAIDSIDYENDYEYILDIKLKVNKYREQSKSKLKVLSKPEPKQEDHDSERDHKVGGEENSKPGNYKPHLPKLALPTIDGSAAEWQSFWDVFSATIDNHPQ